MSQSGMTRVLSELMRRKVVRVAIGYAVVMWLLLQIAEVTFEPLHLPDWALTLLVVIAILGFAVSVILAWAIEVTPEGLKRDASIRQKKSDNPGWRPLTTGVYRSVAVLPFADMSPDGDQNYFCEGLAEEILSSLSSVKCLRVPSRTSSFRFSNGNHDIREIGKALDVETILEGSVRKDVDRIRITAQLIDARNGYHIWARVYDRHLSKVFEVQRELSHDIVRQLCESLSPEEIVIPEPASASDIRAYDYYLQGRHYLNRHTEQAAKFAIQMFNKAASVDPRFALAWAGLSEAHTYMHLNCDDEQDHPQSARNAAQRAVKILPASAPCRTALGMALMISGEYAAADFEFRSALSTNPLQFSASYYYARSCLLQGKLEQAAELFERASERRPEDYQAPLLALSIYRRLGHGDKATAAARRGTMAAECQLELHPDDVRALYLGCLGYLQLGNMDKGRSWAKRAVELNPTDALTRYNVACFYTQVGEIELAIDNLSKMNINRKEFRDWMENDPDLDPLRADQRFIALTRAA